MTTHSHASGEESPLSDFTFEEKDSKLIKAYLYFSFIAIFFGGLAGLLQLSQRAGWITLPSWLTYYQLLTAHGVLLALVFTTFFIVGYLFSGMVRTLDGKLTSVERGLGWTGFYLMAIGTVMAFIIILTNDGTVLYTFYSPMAASPWFYLGLALLIIGTWLASFAMISAYVRWRKQNKGESSPLFAYMTIATIILWIHASFMVAIEVVCLLLPWSMGIVERIDPTLTRTMFWYFGHALVYFWLLPAYIYWYVNIPQIVGGKVFSSALPRLTFILLILFSVPVGLHHQLTEPGIESFWKFLQVILTMMVVVPSLMTAFSIIATFELAGRSRGGTGLFGWVKKLPWKDARFFVTMMGMLMFIPGGAGGIINSSFQLNQVIHNTWWVTGHFHLTFATSVVLTFFAITYWLIPVLTKRVLTKQLNRLAIVQSIIWTIGMILMGVVMHFAGILGSPRRTSYSDYGGHELGLKWMSYNQVIAVGGVLLFISIVLVLYIWIQLIFFSPKSDKTIEYPIGVINEKAANPPKILERWSVWITVSIILSIVAYAVPFYQIFISDSPGSLPIRSW